MKPLYRLFAALLAAVLVWSGLPAAPARAAGILYAAPAPSGLNNCFSWANACTLAHALSIANNSDQIWVKAGVHYPGANQTDTFTLKNGVEIYGGFAGTPGTEGNFSVRDWQTYRTILSGDIDQNDTNTDGNYIAETTADIQGSNAYHVVTGGGTDSSAVLDGFVITAGQANGSSPQRRRRDVQRQQQPDADATSPSAATPPPTTAAGCTTTSSSPTLTNVTFSGNSASIRRRDVQRSSSPTLTNVTFSGNSAQLRRRDVQLTAARR
jgi:hypothetical protein